MFAHAARIVCLLLAGLLNVCMRDVFWGFGWSVYSCRPRGWPSYLATTFFVGGRALVSATHFGLLSNVFVIISNRSARPPGSNQVDGLPPALSLLGWGFFLRLFFLLFRYHAFGLLVTISTSHPRGNFG